MPAWFYGPTDWLADRTDARYRRALGFWMAIVFVAATVMTWTRVEHQLATHIVQVLTLTLLLWTIMTTETPVEEEEG